MCIFRIHSAVFFFHRAEFSNKRFCPHDSFKKKLYKTNNKLVEMFNIVVYIASILGMTANAQFIRMECPGFQNTTFVVPFFKQGSTNRPACAYQNHKYTFYTSNSNDTVNYPVVSRMSCLSCPTSWTPSALLNSTCEPDTDSTLFGCPSGNFLSEAASVNDT